MDFEEYCKTTKFSEKQNENARSDNKQNDKVESQQMTEEALKKELNKYQNMSENALFDELLKETNKQKQNGNLTNKKLEEMGEKLKPMLSSEQQNRLEKIIKMLR
jgi:hypothetical protein